MGHQSQPHATIPAAHAPPDAVGYVTVKPVPFTVTPCPSPQLIQGPPSHGRAYATQSQCWSRCETRESRNGETAGCRSFASRPRACVTAGQTTNQPPNESAASLSVLEDSSGGVVEGRRTQFQRLGLGLLGGFNGQNHRSCWRPGRAKFCILSSLH